MEIQKIWITDTAVHIITADGREAKENLADYPRLKNAPREALEDYTYDIFGIHWESLDEDLCFENFFQEKRTNPLYEMFMSHPEINVSALARRLGISQSLMAQYIGGNKRPSHERTEAIIAELHKIGKELTAIS